MSGRADLLAEMAAASAARLAAARRIETDAALAARARAEPPAPALGRSSEGFDLIAEIKLISPSAGHLAAAGSDLEERASAYARAGAAAVSVLTEPQRFGGSLEHLRQVAQTLAPLGVPAMRKDFLVDPYQVLEARAAGAGGVLLILRMLEDRPAAEMLECARGLGMFVLLECFDAGDLERATDLVTDISQDAQVLIGINVRDLSTLAVDLGRLESLAAHCPPRFPRVAESGIVEPEDAGFAAGLGYDLALVGTALMRDAHPEARMARLLEVGRAAHRECSNTCLCG